MKVQTFYRSPTMIDESIAFCGLDYRSNKTAIYGIANRDDYQEVHQNKTTGEVVLIDSLGQFSRETRITVFATYQEYKETVEAQRDLMARLTGRI